MTPTVTATRMTTPMVKTTMYLSWPLEKKKKITNLTKVAVSSLLIISDHMATLRTIVRKGVSTWCYSANSFSGEEEN